MAFKLRHAVPLLTLAGALLFGPGLEANDRREPVWARGRTPVDRALSNLQRAARNARWIDSHERKHLERATRELVRFQERWYDGRFDRGRLDKAIENIQDLADSRQLHPMDRRVLSADLHALRDFRSRGGHYAGRRDDWRGPLGGW